MNDTIILGAFFLILLAAVSFYFYSRILYTERKLGLLESILLDIKMMLEMEDERQHDHLPAAPPASNKIVDSSPEEAAFYSAVLEEVQKEANAPVDLGELPPAAPSWNEMPSETGPTGTVEPTIPQKEEVVVSPANYDSMTREELAAHADKRGIRTTKRMSKNNIISLLREVDKNTSAASGAGRDGDGPSGASSGIPSLEGSNGGAPLDMEQVEELSVDV